MSHSNDSDPSRRVLRLIEGRHQITEKVWGDSRLYNHSFLCSVSLPHRSLPISERTYVRKSGSISLQLTAGSIPTADGDFEDVGIPYGSRARLLLLHLCSQAVLNRSPIVEVQDSFTSFARSMGLPTCGRSLKSLREQTVRMSVVSMRLSKRGEQYIETFQTPLFSHFQAEYPSDHRQKTLFASYVQFSEPFYRSLIDHSVPLRIEAIRSLSHPRS